MTTHPNETPEPLAGATVDFCISALVSALQRDKGWLHDYADSVVRDAIDRKHLEPLALPAHPEPHSHTWTEQEKHCILAWGAELVSTNAAALQAKDAEIARLKADAGRFQWLLDNANLEHDPSEPYQLVIWEPGTGQDWRAIVRSSIDAAMAKEGAHG